jgi:hypothetical protein
MINLPMHQHVILNSFSVASIAICYSLLQAVNDNNSDDDDDYDDDMMMIMLSAYKRCKIMYWLTNGH